MEKNTEHGYPIPVEYYGTFYTSITKACKALQVNNSTVLAEMHRYPYLAFQEIVDRILARKKHPARKGNRIGILYHGVLYRTIKDICQEVGVPESKIYSRHHYDPDVPIEELVDAELEKQRKAGCEKPIPIRIVNSKSFMAYRQLT